MKHDLTTEGLILSWDAALGQINAQFELWLMITVAAQRVLLNRVDLGESSI